MGNWIKEMDKTLLEIGTESGIIVQAKSDRLGREYVVVTSPKQNEDGTVNLVITPFLRPGTSVRCAQEIADEI